MIRPLPSFAPVARLEAELSEDQQEERALLEMAQLETALWSEQDDRRASAGPIEEASAIYQRLWAARMARWGHKPERFHERALARAPVFEGRENDPDPA